MLDAIFLMSFKIFIVYANLLSKLIINTLDYFKIEREAKQRDSSYIRSCLFNYFVNDLHDIFDESCGLLKLENTFISSLTFVDDLVIFSNSHKGLQNVLNKLQKYCFDWQVTVNTNTSRSKILAFQKVYTLLHFCIMTNHLQKHYNIIFWELL